MKTKTKQFKVAAVSTNHGFGLQRFIFVARDGKSLEALGNDLRAYRMGTVVELKAPYPEALSELQFECPGEFVPCPTKVVEEIWNNEEIELCQLTF